MGGNAIKSARRMTPAEHEQLFYLVRDQLKTQFPGLNLYKLQHYANKPDFGNLSFVVNRNTAHTEQQVRDYLKHTLANGSAYENGDFIAVGVNGFQVDVTFVEADTSHMARAYLAYNGLGALLGKVAHSMGLILRATGLYYREMDGSVLVTEFGVARYWQGVCVLLGYDFARWEKGFSDLEDLFKFVASSPNFRPEVFRDTDPVGPDARPTVAQLFSQWLQQAPTADTRPALLQLLHREVVGFSQARTDALDAYARDKAQRLAAREKFTGHLVAEWTGRNGRDLGMLMQHIENAFGGKSGVQEWVLASAQNSIKDTVLQMHGQFRPAVEA